MTSWWTCSRAGNTAFVEIRDEIGAFDEGCELEHLLETLHGADEIFLKIDSSGGDSGVALELFQALSGRCRQSLIRRACSCAAIVALAADHVLIESDGKIMIHQAQAAVYGSALELRKVAEKVADRNETFVEIIHAHIGKSTKKIWKLFDGNDHWFSAPEAVEYGLANEILKVATIRTDETGDKPLPDSFKIETDDSEKLLLDMLQAIGPVQTSNRRALFERIGHWARTNITES